ncbi:MAG: DEAD/DEAH box helicase [Candidatus Gastranaerophilales bacterium]|nr:DEAD/DEAH box helicase [Candidatus Gastranaerophilales bacterium]
MLIQQVGPKHASSKLNNANHSVGIQYQIADKQIGLNDLIFYKPSKVKCSISFGSDKPILEKAKNFDDSVDKYFRLTPDPYQVRAAKTLYNGDDAIVVAPTGTGKTLIAEYIINKNVAEGKKTFYTTPLKALSNEKKKDFTHLYEAFDELSQKWGNEKVGLMTGDIKINPDAPIQVMTTEIYNNMLLGDNKKTLENLATVIYDEFHTMNDPERGTVWETSVMYTPPKVQQLALSGTVGNGEVVTGWFNRLKALKAEETGIVNDKKTELVYMASSERYVPLKFHVFDPKTNKLAPLLIEKYNIDKLEASLKEDAIKPLGERQKEVLVSVSKHAGGNETPEDGIRVLKEIVAKPSDLLDSLENSLREKLGIQELDARRIAAHLSDKDEQKFNAVQLANATQEKKPAKIISRKLITSLHQSGKLRTESQQLLKQISTKMHGDGTVEDGIKRLGGVINNQDMTPFDAKNQLVKKKFDKKFAQEIVSALALSPRPPRETSAELAVVDILKKQDKLPAIVFKFSKKGCESVRDEMLTRPPMLNKEDQETVTQVVNEYKKRNIFLGTDEGAKSFNWGVTVHHSGKMPANKEITELLAQNKLSHVTMATSTLGAGINVPARSTVLTQLTIAGRELSVNEFHQMAGRAGRRGKDPVGDVVVFLDKEHNAYDIYKKVTAKPDPIISTFRPQYNFISNFIPTNKPISEAVDRSFLYDVTVASGRDPEKTMGKVKKDFEKMAKLLIDPTSGCFEKTEDGYTPTLKGMAVSKARGVDGLLFAETMFKAPLDDVSPSQLAAIACYLTQGDEKNLEQAVKLDETTAFGIDRVRELQTNIDKVEKRYGIQKTEQFPNLYASQFVKKWVDVPEEEALNGWEKIVIQSNSKNFDEGDLFKSVNSTLDVLQQFRETADLVAKEALKKGESLDFVKRMKKISMNADVAVKRITKNPIAEFHAPIGLEHLKIRR